MRNTLCLLALAAMATSLAHGASLGTGISYQGRLTDNGGPANGTYSFRFRLFGDETGSTQIGPTVDVANQAIADGLINTTLDFGAAAFNSDARWLEVSVKPGGTGNAAEYIKLNPQPLPPGGSSQFSRVAGDVLNGVITGAKLAPLSVNATHITDGAVSGSKLAPGSVSGGNVADNALTAGKISGGQVVKSLNGLHDDVTLAPGANVVLTTNGNSLQISAVGGVGGSGGWGLSGNVTASGSFIGTVNNQPMEVRANDIRALKLEPNATSPNLIGGWDGNRVDAGVSGAVIGGGGTLTVLGRPGTNRVTDHFGTVSGGANNIAGLANGDFQDGWFATVGGGQLNRAEGVASTIAGGSENRTSNNDTTVGGGWRNQAIQLRATVSGGEANVASGPYSVIAGGVNNRAEGIAGVIGGGAENRATNNNSTVSGGYRNAAVGWISTIGGGEDNFASADFAAIGGGQANGAGFGAVVGGGMGNNAEGLASTIPGGQDNYAGGAHSFAAGYGAQARHNGSFVWSDAQQGIFGPIPFESTLANQFSIRAQGGMSVSAGDISRTGDARCRSYVLRGTNALRFAGSFEYFPTMYLGVQPSSSSAKDGFAIPDNTAVSYAIDAVAISPSGQAVHASFRGGFLIFHGRFNWFCRSQDCPNPDVTEGMAQLEMSQVGISFSGGAVPFPRFLPAPFVDPADRPFKFAIKFETDIGLVVNDLRGWRAVAVVRTVEVGL